MSEARLAVDSITEQLRREWTEGATAWSRWHRQWHEQSRAATEAIVGLARIEPGMRVLDLASGSGEPALTLAARVGPRGHVVATDLVLDMMKPLAEHARSSDVRNVDCVQADMEHLPMPDQSFDAATARFAVVFCRRPVNALAEMRRVLRPGARAAVLVWGRRDQELFRVTAGVFGRYVKPPSPVPGEPNPFQFGEPGTLTAALKTAGFRRAGEETRVLPWVFPGGAEETWRARREISAPLFHRLFDALPRELHGRVDEEIVAALRAHEVDGRVSMTAEVVCAWGER